MIRIAIANIIAAWITDWRFSEPINASSCQSTADAPLFDSTTLRYALALVLALGANASRRKRISEASAPTIRSRSWRQSPLQNLNLSGEYLTKGHCVNVSHHHLCFTCQNDRSR